MVALLTEVPPDRDTLSPGSLGDSGVYTSRVLPEAEWDRLPPDVRQALTPGYAIVVVVETEQGEIIARWCALNVIHLEGLLIDPAYRHSPKVAGRLFGHMILALREKEIPSVLTLVQEPTVQALAEKVGFVALPGTLNKLDL
jgi:hypothetical protein